MSKQFLEYFFLLALKSYKVKINSLISCCFIALEHFTEFLFALHAIKLSEGISEIKQTENLQVM